MYIKSEVVLENRANNFNVFNIKCEYSYNKSSEKKS